MLFWGRSVTTLVMLIGVIILGNPAKKRYYTCTMDGNTLNFVLGGMIQSYACAVTVS